MKKITEMTTIGALLKEHSETARVLKRYKLECFGCQGTEQESLRNAAWAHGIDLDTLLKDLNEAIVA